MHVVNWLEGCKLFIGCTELQMQFICSLAGEMQAVHFLYRSTDVIVCSLVGEMQAVHCLYRSTVVIVCSLVGEMQAILGFERKMTAAHWLTKYERFFSLE